MNNDEIISRMINTVILQVLDNIKLLRSDNIS